MKFLFWHIVSDSEMQKLEHYASRGLMAMREDRRECEEKIKLRRELNATKDELAFFHRLYVKELQQGSLHPSAGMESAAGRDNEQMASDVPEWCGNGGCPFKDCERHPENCPEKGERSVDYNLGCRRYISRLVDEMMEEHYKDAEAEGEI